MSARRYLGSGLSTSGLRSEQAIPIGIRGFLAYCSWTIELSGRHAGVIMTSSSFKRLRNDVSNVLNDLETLFDVNAFSSQLPAPARRSILP